ncbi:MAG TPA: ornithine cyclodeaminase family protein [Thermoanaerobaculia bacterium]|nr:ornithine cyclodeaminase family protein [Thermoanaerobaculia bacterium]
MPSVPLETAAVPKTLVLTRADVESLLDLDSCFAAVEEAFRQHGAGEVPAPGALGLRTAGGGFHVKAGILGGSRPLFAAKVNGNFQGNDARGLPRIQGVVVLADAEAGSPLAVMDSSAITRLRTAAATAVAAKHLARPDSKTIMICGCGVQGRAQLRALARVLAVEAVFCFDEERERALRFTQDLAPEVGFPIVAADDLRSAARASDVVVTCTPSKNPILFFGFLRPGAFLAAIGADSEEKQEVDSSLMASSTIVTDVTDQCAAFGDLHHALASGLVARGDVHGELGEIVAGRKPGRSSGKEIIVFDSTGMALQDAAAAAVVLERARATGRGIEVDFAA